MPLTDNPGGVSIVPELSVRRGRAAVEFYKAAFGAIEVYRVGGTDDNPDVVAQLSVGSASFWVSDESPPHANFSPESVGGGTVRMLLIVDDPDSALERAKAAGASEVYPVGERARLASRPDQGSLRPPLGDRKAAHSLAARRPTAPRQPLAATGGRNPPPLG